MRRILELIEYYFLMTLAIIMFFLTIGALGAIIWNIIFGNMPFNTYIEQ